MILLVQIYLWVAIFTYFSILFEARWCGSKSDYMHLYERAVDTESFRMTWFAYTFVLVVGSLLWPAVYYYRFKDWKG